MSTPTEPSRVSPSGSDIEAAAKALYEHEHPSDEWEWAIAPHRDIARGKARAALSAVPSRGVAGERVLDAAIAYVEALTAPKAEYNKARSQLAYTVEKFRLREAGSDEPCATCRDTGEVFDYGVFDQIRGKTPCPSCSGYEGKTYPCPCPVCSSGAVQGTEDKP